MAWCLRLYVEVTVFMSKSVNRVKRRAEELGLQIDILRMGGSTRTAQEAASQCGCAVDQIVKSLIFMGKTSGKLYLFLVRGSERLDMDLATDVAGEALERAEARLIREETGFAIGGVSPIGHLNAIKAFADKGLLKFDTVWAAAGAHDAVFEAETGKLLNAAKAEIEQIVRDG